jgi:hypothetical protein
LEYSASTSFNSDWHPVYSGFIVQYVKMAMGRHPIVEKLRWFHSIFSHLGGLSDAIYSGTSGPDNCREPEVVPTVYFPFGWSNSGMPYYPDLVTKIGNCPRGGRRLKHRETTVLPGHPHRRTLNLLPTSLFTPLFYPSGLA